jgi:hypothetical protein
VSRRPLAIVSGLAIGDYLLWNWSLNHHRDVLALVSGLTLPPLALACLWLLALNLALLLARTTRRSQARPDVAARAGRDPRRPPAGAPAAGSLQQSSASPSPSPASTDSSRKLAA